MKNYEILSPAGSEEQLKAAVFNGCDAVYLGLEGFNARMKAPNFTAENLRQWVDFCHLFGVKVYVTVNTSVKNSEFQLALETLISAYKNNADGVIVTDLALLQYAATLPKPFDVVASTQLNTHDKYGARFLRRLGATTIVCARECSLQQVEQIAAEGVKTECFLHGALCVCQSGQCLFSSMVGGNSGNRGLCAQPCRKLYSANGKDFAYLLSAADICGVDSAEDLLKAGARIFKIEGRNRSAQYAGVTAKVYSELFENHCCSDKAKEMLAEVFNRGNLPVNGYLYDRNDNIIFPLVQNHIGVQVGLIRNGKFFAEKPVCAGDGLKVLKDGKEVCGGRVVQSGVGFVAAEFSQKVGDGATVHRTMSVEIANQTKTAQRKIAVKAHFVAKANSKPILTLQSQNSQVVVLGNFEVQQAEKVALSKSDIAKQLCKTGNSYFTISDITIDYGNIFIAKSQLNELRRNAIATMHDKILLDYRLEFVGMRDVVPPFSSKVRKKTAENCLFVLCRTLEEVEACKQVANRVIFKPEDLSQVPDGDFYLDLPSFCDLDFLKKQCKSKHFGLVCHNVGQVQFARENNIRYIAGTGLNLFNDQMISLFDDADAFFYSLELTLAEINSLARRDGVVFVDGELTFMKMVHCPYKTVFKCSCANCKAEQGLQYIDEQGNNFFVRRRKDSRCTFELANGRKLSVAARLKSGGRFCVDYNPNVLQHYVNLNKGIVDDFAEPAPYTKGRLFDKIN